MLFRQFVDDDLGCASYLVGDQASGKALLIDPSYAIEPYVAEAERLGVRIVRVLETHTHADHVSGHGRLALEHGVGLAKTEWLSLSRTPDEIAIMRDLKRALDPGGLLNPGRVLG